MHRKVIVVDALKKRERLTGRKMVTILKYSKKLSGKDDETLSMVKRKGSIWKYAKLLLRCIKNKL